MSEHTINYREEIERLKKESVELEQKIEEAREAKNQLEDLQKEKDRRQNVKEKIQELEQKGKLLADKIPDGARFLNGKKEPVTVKTSTAQKTQVGQKTVSGAVSEPLTLTAIILSVIMIFCSLGSWLSTFDENINLLTVMKMMNTASSWGSSIGVGGYLDQYKGMLWMLIISIWLIGINAGWMIFRLIRGRNIKVNAIVGTCWSTLLVLILVIATKNVSSRSYGFGLISIDMQVNMKAYVTVLLSVAVLVLAFCRKDISSSMAKPETAVGKTSPAVSCMIENVYPWMNIQLEEGTLNQNECFVSYQYEGIPIEGVNVEKMGSRVSILTDMVLKTTEAIYAIKNAELVIPALQKSGRTEAVYFDSFSGQVQSVQVFIKSVHIDGKEKQTAYGFHVNRAEILA